MNYHYIEYMLKEQKKEEIEACERMRLLKAAGYSGGGMEQQAWYAVTDKARQWLFEIRSRLVRYGYCLLHRKFAIQIKGKSL